MKHKSIELIGISGSGKSYTEQEIRRETKNYLRIYNRREIVLKFISKFINLTIEDRLTILYFSLLNIFKKNQINQLKVEKKKIEKKNFKSTNYFRKNYEKLCKKLFHIYCLKNKKFKEQLDFLIKNLKNMEEKNILFWFYELCAARYIFERTSNENYIFLNDEGFIPKSFLFIYTKLKFKDKKKRILKYLDTIPYPDLSILLYKNKKNIFKIHEIRNKYNLQLYFEKKILIDIIKINKVVEKYLNKRTKIVKIYNNHQILQKLIKVIEYKEFQNKEQKPVKSGNTDDNGFFMKIIKKKFFDYIGSAGFLLKEKKFFDKYESIPSIDNQQQKILSIASKFTMTSKVRQYALIGLLEYIFKNKINGDLVECGTWLGGNLIIFDKLKKKYRSSKKIYGYDTFYGMPKPETKDKDYKGNKFINSYRALNKRYYSISFKYKNIKGKFNISTVKKILQKNKVNPKDVKLIEGKVEETLTIKKNLPKKISLLRLDTDWYKSTNISIKKLFPLIVKGGVLIVDDYGWNSGCKKAIDDFFKKKKIASFFRIDHEAVFLIK